MTAKPPGASTATTVASGVSYYGGAFGPVWGLNYGNGITNSHNYDLDYNPTWRADRNGTASVVNLSYGYYGNDSLHTVTMR